ncbi:MAG: hydroxymethylbilane synthase [Gemmatimonadaceae bacterium]|nr:hydroxymethylbilane synthase [Gemmatimonadaceae bacterium]
MPPDAPPLVIGTRGSPLATRQAGLVRDALAGRFGDELPTEIRVVRTQGDVDRRSLSQIGGQGVFTAELERALLDGRVDLAVHSLKDLPTTMDPRLRLAAVPEREDVRDVLVSRGGAGLDDLPAGASVATGSARRRAQLAAVRPDLAFVDLRGNVDTRLAKVAAGEVDAVVLAAAGLRRLGREAEISCHLDPLTVLPAPGQGALGLQMRADDGRVGLVAALSHPPTLAAVTAERAFLAGLGGGCGTPIGAWGRPEDGGLRVDGAVLSPDGRDSTRDSVRGPLEAAEPLGADLAGRVKAGGGQAILSACAA